MSSFCCISRPAITRKFSELMNQKNFSNQNTLRALVMLVMAATSFSVCLVLRSADFMATEWDCKVLISLEPADFFCTAQIEVNVHDDITGHRIHGLLGLTIVLCLQVSVGITQVHAEVIGLQLEGLNPRGHRVTVGRGLGHQLLDGRPFDLVGQGRANDHQRIVDQDFVHFDELCLASVLNLLVLKLDQSLLVVLLDVLQLLHGLFLLAHGLHLDLLTLHLTEKLVHGPIKALKLDHGLIPELGQAIGMKVQIGQELSRPAVSPGSEVTALNDVAASRLRGHELGGLSPDDGHEEGIMLLRDPVASHLHRAGQTGLEQEVSEEGRSVLEVGRDQLLEAVAGLGLIPDGRPGRQREGFHALAGQLDGVGLADQELVLALDPGSEDGEDVVLKVGEHHVAPIIQLEDEMVRGLEAAELEVHHPVHAHLPDGLEALVLEVLAQLHGEARGRRILGPLELGGVETRAGLEHEHALGLGRADEAEEVGLVVHVVDLVEPHAHQALELAQLGHQVQGGEARLHGGGHSARGFTTRRGSEPNESIIDLLHAGIKLKDLTLAMIRADRRTKITDGIPAGLESVLPDIWKNYPPEHPMITDFFAVVIFILWGINVVGNGLVIFVFLTTKTLRTPTNMFVVNLAFSDLCMMTFMGPSVAVNAFVSDYWIYGALYCQLYGLIGAIFGTASLLTMVVIGFDRYNVIVKGMAGTRITGCKAFSVLLFIWVYVILGALPPFFGWGGFALDGLLITCSYDYYTYDWNKLSYCLFAFVTHYFLPLLLVMFYYGSIVKAVVQHERALKAQAKKMNVTSLRSGGDEGQSAEIRICKVAITNVSLWFLAWTPYAVVFMFPIFGKLHWITPLMSQLPIFFAKTASCFNPVVFALSHPKYREALASKCPCFGIHEQASKAADEKTQAVSTN
eukprot:maker-scaffold103_size370364-snap-gene-0.19 protein:Tk07511 transcript:maker-scaffold103_size370364-snap-gene-0.19-mRNA-1 annotation:"opsin"